MNSIPRDLVAPICSFDEERVDTEKLRSLTFSAGACDNDIQNNCNEARVGRDKQRYESTGLMDDDKNKVRLLSGTVPILRGDLILLINR